MKLGLTAGAPGMPCGQGSEEHSRAGGEASTQARVVLHDQDPRRRRGPAASVGSLAEPA